MQTNDEKHNLKIGTFQLQTKSFWITLVSLLTSFLVFSIYVNIRFYYKTAKDVMDHDEKLVQTIITLVLKNPRIEK